MIDQDKQQEFVRLSPWAILHFAASTVVQIVNSVVALAAGGYGLYQVGNFALVAAGVVTLIALVFLSAVLRYWYFSYLIQGASVQIKEGVLSKKNLNLQFHRIQNVNIQHPFYFRPLGLVTVKVESAGSATEEVSLAALSLAAAERIREEVSRYHQDEAFVPEQDAEPAAPFLTRSLSDLVIHGLTNNRAWIILGVVGTLYSQVSEGVNTYIASLGIDLSGFVTSAGAIALLVVALGALIISVSLVAALSVAGSILSYYRFEMYRSDEAFRVRRGLLTRHEINMRKSRIQSVRVRRDWLDMALGRMNVILEQIAHALPGQNPGVNANQHILVPSVEIAQTDQLTHEALAGPHLGALEFTGVSSRYFYKFAVITLGGYCALGLVANSTPIGLAGLALLLPLMGAHISLLYLSWKRWGIAIDGELVIVRKGIIGVDHALVPAFKIQEISRVQTPLMRRRALSTLKFSVASGSFSVPFLPDHLVTQAIDYCLYQTEATDRSWM